MSTPLEKAFVGTSLPALDNLVHVEWEADCGSRKSQPAPKSMNLLREDSTGNYGLVST